MSPAVVVLAHGVGSAQDLPLPFDLVLQAGAVMVVLSFLAVSRLWRVPRATEAWRLPGAWDAALRAPAWRAALRAGVLALPWSSRTSCPACC